MKDWKRTGNMILRILLSIILVLNVTIICVELTAGSNALAKLPYTFLSVEGGSMEPDYHPGDGVFVWQTPFSKLEVGDVIVFMQDGELVTHRIIEISDGVVIAKGTANDIEDDPVTEDNYRAKVLFRIPGIGILQSIYESPVTMLIYMVALVLLIFGKDIFTKVYESIFGRRK